MSQNAHSLGMKTVQILGFDGFYGPKHDNDQSICEKAKRNML